MSSQARSEKSGSRMNNVLQRWSGVMMNNYGTPAARPGQR